MKMWSAYIIIILAAGPIQIADTRGPYETKIECTERLQELRASVEVMRIRAVAGFCKPSFVETA